MINVSNMPENVLYKFDNDRYVIAFRLNETRNGAYHFDEPTRITEVYTILGNGLMDRIASGRLVDNPSVFNYNEKFAINDYERDDMITFGVTMPLQQAGVEEFKKLREKILSEGRMKRSI